MIPVDKTDSGGLPSKINEDIEASTHELRGLAYTGLFLAGVLAVGVAGICWVVW